MILIMLYILVSLSVLSNNLKFVYKFNILDIIAFMLNLYVLIIAIKYMVLIYFCISFMVFIPYVIRVANITKGGNNAK